MLVLFCKEIILRLVNAVRRTHVRYSLVCKCLNFANLILVMEPAGGDGCLDSVFDDCVVVSVYP